MQMITKMYDEYLYVIGKIKDVHKLSVDVDHKDIHTFYKDKVPKFKLLFGTYNDDNSCIVVSFHIDVNSMEAIQWFLNIKDIHPLAKITEPYVEDEQGETWLGKDAQKIRDMIFERDIIAEWVDDHDEEELQTFADSKVVGRLRNPKQTYNSQYEREKAIIEFDMMKKPIEDDEVQ